MFRIDVNLLDYKIKRAGVTREAVASACDCSRTTLWRHLRDGTITIREIYGMVSFLALSEQDVKDIFFAAHGA